MSTRCNIIIKSGYADNARVILYHRHDGYPEGVGVQLKKVLAGYEPWQLKQYGDTRIPTGLVKNQFGLNDNEYEIANGLAGDIDYLYVINCKAGSLRCFRVDFDDNLRYDYSKVVKRDRLVNIPEWDGGKTVYEQ